MAWCCRGNQGTSAQPCTKDELKYNTRAFILHPYNAKRLMLAVRCSLFILSSMLNVYCLPFVMKVVRPGNNPQYNDRENNI